jgi:hypothetical protein
MPDRHDGVPWVPLLDRRTADLFLQAEADPSDSSVLAAVRAVRARCAEPQVAARYAGAGLPAETAGRYPLDADGYAVSFDPLEDERGFAECWRRCGFVVGRSVAPPALLAAAVRAARDALAALAPGFDPADPATLPAAPADASGVPLVSRGFLEIHHDAALADLRQSLRVWLHHVLVWGRADLWTSFDRMGLKLPGGEGSGALPLHVDQNPRVHPGFRTVQGVLALEECPEERGTFVGAPGSRAHFEAYAAFAPPRGDYVELPAGHPIRDAVEPQPVPLRAGDLVTWDSRTTHANSPNLSAAPRWVAYVAAGPAREHDPDAVAARLDSFRTGVGANVRDALMHASKKPRYEAPAVLAGLRAPERLTALGRLLYGIDLWDGPGVAS